jgi:type I restriction enzyme S subunit
LPQQPEKSLAIQSEIVGFWINLPPLPLSLPLSLPHVKQYNYYRDQLLSFEEVRLSIFQWGKKKNYSGGSLQKSFQNRVVAHYG